MVKKSEAKATITGGEVSYGRTVPTGDYASKRSDVKLFFALPDGADASSLLDEVIELAKSKAMAMVGLKPTADPLPASDKVGDLSDVKPGAAATKELAAQKMNEADALKNASLPKGLERKGNDTDPEKSAAQRKKEAVEAEKAAAASGDAEDFGEFNEDDDSTLPEVTDEVLKNELNAAVGRLTKTHKGEAPKMARALIAKFVEPPKKSGDIPQNLRHKFIAELKALT